MDKNVKENSELITHMIFQYMKRIREESLFISNMVRQFSIENPPDGPLSTDIQRGLSQLQEDNMMLARYEGIQAEYQMYIDNEEGK